MRQYFMKILFVLLSHFIISSIANAEVIVKDNAIYLTGELHQNQLDEFKKTLEEVPQTKEIIIQKCVGGTVLAARLFSELIVEKQLSTVAEAQVSSACAFAFMAGKRRRFSEKPGANFVGFHGARSKDSKQPEPSSTSSLMEFLLKRTDGKLDIRLQKLISDSWKPAEGVVFLSRNYYFFKISETRYCDGSGGSNLSLCDKLPDFDHYKNGILTTP